mmetsp:Transcript_26448/g.83800  ORF Transcript_26448/g.83800 Transcript_26448/m.83800 type:complete len:298 (-) Transcript_26448:1091-1984(-)
MWPLFSKAKSTAGIRPSCSTSSLCAPVRMQTTPLKPSCRSCTARSEPRTKNCSSSRSMFWSITAMSAGGRVAGFNDNSLRPMTTSTKLCTSSAVPPMEPLRLGSACTKRRNSTSCVFRSISESSIPMHTGRPDTGGGGELSAKGVAPQSPRVAPCIGAAAAETGAGSVGGEGAPTGEGATADEAAETAGGANAVRAAVEAAAAAGGWSTPVRAWSSQPSSGAGLAGNFRWKVVCMSSAVSQARPPTNATAFLTETRPTPSLRARFFSLMTPTPLTPGRKARKHSSGDRWGVPARLVF